MGLTTTGMNVKFTDNNSPTVGAKDLLTIKPGGINTPEFQTVIPAIDPRWRVSFGGVTAKP